MMFSVVRVRCNDIETQWAESSFREPLLLLTRDQTSLQRLKAFSNLSKHETSRGWTPWEACEGEVIRSNPIWWAYLTTSIVTSKLWPSRISKCWFSLNIAPPATVHWHFSQNATTTFKKGRRHPHVGLHGHATSCLTFWDALGSHLFTFENVKVGCIEFSMLSFIKNDRVYLTCIPLALGVDSSLET